MNYKLVISALISISLLSACQNKPSRSKSIETVSISAIPDWVNNPPSDSANFLYGSGVAINKKKAIKEALVDLSSKLGIHVQSKFQTSTKVTCNGYYETIEKNSEGNIKTEVKDLYI
ncbi:hypothetical protein BPLS_P5312 [Bathymodiolus platifrons methanotrophic gill symbiont]|uniref:LPP20 family lipoprotein n=1 Tax=Bathymodiolus platifrons methanotrophic gill symbiont TaxID=113268 RepID=UPI001B663182|nr:LPP20 family lipoprotein [Bathymodiolus platifrons methanotrophic gill symbiont]GFO77095.1 hypothetical protein BPLS_P5312 [Bathymodiolus platifrons methanotrophic gill symbiont]